MEVAVQRKPLQARFNNIDEFELEVIGWNYKLTRNFVALPILLDGEFADLMQLRSKTCRKAVLKRGPDCFFLKELPWYLSERQKIAVANLMRFLDVSSPIKIASIIESRNGVPYTEIEDDIWILLCYVPGKTYFGAENSIASVCQTLAILHAIAPDVTTYSDIRQTSIIRSSMNLIMQTASESADPVSDKALTYLIERCEEWVGRAIPFETTLSTSIVHGDISPWNFIFAPSGDVEATVDWDNAGIGSRLIDVAATLLSFYIFSYQGTSTTFAPNLATYQMNIDKARDCLGHYQALNPLTVSEVEALPVWIEGVTLEFLLLGFIRGEYKGTTKAELSGFYDKVRVAINSIVRVA